MPEPRDTPAVRSAQGHVAHWEEMIAKWTKRRDEGDCVPDCDTLDRWIADGERQLADWRKALDRARLEAVG